MSTKKEKKSGKTLKKIAIAVILALFLGLAFFNAATRSRIESTVQTGIKDATGAEIVGQR